MLARRFLRLALTLCVGLIALVVIGAALNPTARAAATTVRLYPDTFPCSTTLQACIDGSADGDVIQIKPGTYLGGVTLYKAVSLIGLGTITPTTLIAPLNQRVLTVTSAIITASTAISNLHFTGGQLTGSDCANAACGGAILLAGTARPTLAHLTIDNNSAYQGGGVWVDAGPEVVIIDSKIISNSTPQAGGGIYSAANVRLINTWIERNHSNDNGGGLDVVGALDLTNSVVVSNTAANGGGGARVSGSAVLNAGRFTSNRSGMGGGLFASTLSMTNTEFTDNEANGNYGGGVYVNGPVQLNGGRFERNRSQGFGNGGGLYAMGLNARGTVFISNTASSLSAAGYGGGAYLSSNPSMLENVSFIDNTSTQSGGGLYAGGPALTLNNVSFISNTTTQGSGGGLQAQSAQVTGGVFDLNTSAAGGGGVAAFNNLRLVGVRLTNNASGDQGGGVYAAGTVWITNTTFIKNSAQNGGGLYQTPAGDAHIVNALFARNQSAPTQTAGIVFAATGSFSMVHSTIVDNMRNPAAAIAIDNGNAASDLRDNIIAGHARGLNLISGGSFEDYNLYFDNTTNITGLVASGGNSFPNIDPQFVNPADDDYHLRFTSPAINAGLNVGVDFDIDGQPRPIGPGYDIGFDEYAYSIQAEIDRTAPGGTVFIPSGIYTESLTLYKPVSLIGVGPGSTIINAVPNDRVLTVTGNTILPTTQIVSLTLRGGRPAGCSGFCAGGGVLITGTAYPSFRNVVINDNQAVMGGGLYIQTGGVQLWDSSVVGNQATQSGGGAYVAAAAATLEQIGGTIGGNRAIDGAGVFVQEGLFKQTGGVIYGNAASNWGGGLLIGSGGTIRTAQGQLISNSAVISGGGLFIDIGTAELRDSLILSNTASAGGGVYAREMTGTAASLVGGKVENNTALSYGGGVYAGSALTITGTKFYGNRAYDGSALEITGTAQARVVNAFIAGNPATGAFPSTNASVRFDSSGNSVVLHTTLGNATQPLTRALSVNQGVVTVANTIVASYTTGLQAFNGHLVEDYNLFYATPVTATGFISSGGHSLISPDPLFKNPIAGDYHVKGFSPVVNAGTNVGVRRDIDGDARPLGGGFDIGADEASVAGTIPGSNIGGTFTYTTMQNSTINLNVPPGAVTQTTPIYCSLINSDTLPMEPGLRLAGVLFEIEADTDPVNAPPGTINFNVPVTLTVSYTDAELAEAGITDESTMLLYRFETSLNEWKPIGYRPGETQTLDVNNNLITATVLGLSRWAKGGMPESWVEIFLPVVMR